MAREINLIDEVNDLIVNNREFNADKWCVSNARTLELAAKRIREELKEAEGPDWDNGKELEALPRWRCIKCRRLYENYDDAVKCCKKV
jgi:hypothetical protein